MVCDIFVILDTLGLGIYCSPFSHWQELLCWRKVGENFQWHWPSCWLFSGKHILSIIRRSKSLRQDTEETALSKKKRFKAQVVMYCWTCFLLFFPYHIFLLDYLCLSTLFLCLLYFQVYTDGNFSRFGLKLPTHWIKTQVSFFLLIKLYFLVSVLLLLVVVLHF